MKFYFYRQVNPRKLKIYKSQNQHKKMNNCIKEFTLEEIKQYAAQHNLDLKDFMNVAEDKEFDTVIFSQDDNNSIGFAFKRGKQNNVIHLLTGDVILTQCYDPQRNGN